MGYLYSDTFNGILKMGYIMRFPSFGHSKELFKPLALERDEAEWPWKRLPWLHSHQSQCPTVRFCHWYFVNSFQISIDNPYPISNVIFWRASKLSNVISFLHMHAEFFLMSSSVNLPNQTSTGQTNNQHTLNSAFATTKLAIGPSVLVSLKFTTPSGESLTTWPQSH